MKKEKIYLCPRLGPAEIPVVLLKSLNEIITGMEKKKIMVVDDEPDIREILQFNLENAGYEVVPASSAETALELCDQDVDLILLDVMMEGMSGFKMAEVLRKERRSQIPVIFLTARSAENDLLTGFSAGGDDYISKPFSINEVLARVKAVLKRSTAIRQEKPLEQIVLGKLRIDVARKMVYVDGVAVVLPKKELEILTLLASHPGRIYSREEMINELWEDAPYVLDRTVAVHIARIRSKLGVCKSYLTNRSGYGYSMNAEE